MRDKNRIDSFLAGISELWKRNCPDWRFGQLLVNFMRWYGDPFYLEEEEFLSEFEKYMRGEHNLNYKR